MCADCNYWCGPALSAPTPRDTGDGTRVPTADWFCPLCNDPDPHTHETAVRVIEDPNVPADVAMFTNLSEVRVTSATGGEKGSKEARFDLIPVGPLTQLARLYGRGAAKYAARNWERGYDWSLSYAAAQRHMTQFWAGEDVDEEMGLPHPIAAIFHMMALVEFMERHPEFDDRPRG